MSDFTKLSFFEISVHLWFPNLDCRLPTYHQYEATHVQPELRLEDFKPFAFDLENIEPTLDLSIEAYHKCGDCEFDLRTCFSIDDVSTLPNFSLHFFRASSRPSDWLHEYESCSSCKSLRVRFDHSWDVCCALYRNGVLSYGSNWKTWKIRTRSPELERFQLVWVVISRIPLFQVSFRYSLFDLFYAHEALKSAQIALAVWRLYTLFWIGRGSLKIWTARTLLSSERFASRGDKRGRHRFHMSWRIGDRSDLKFFVFRLSLYLLFGCWCLSFGLSTFLKLHLKEGETRQVAEYGARSQISVKFLRSGQTNGNVRWLDPIRCDNHDSGLWCSMNSCPHWTKRPGCT